MGERNDLIMELTEIAQDRHGAKNTHLLSWLEKGYFHCQHGSEEWCQGDYLDSARAYIERLEAVAKDALTTIANLSEALAEAERKGAEDWQPIETAPKYGQILALWPSIRRGKHMGAVLQTTWTGTRWWRPTIHNDAEGPTHWRPFAPPRDLSQGGQHG